MLSLIKLLTVIPFIHSQMIPGSQTDVHGCALDGGYSWCETLQQCHRPWEENCPLQIGVVDFCPDSEIQSCRMVCPEPQCPSGNCAMRNDNCCDYSCSDETISCSECLQMEPPCAAPPKGCRYVPSVQNNCGCEFQGCGTIDCSTQHIPPPQHISSEGGVCGGFMPQGMSNSCENGFECVNTMGPYIADAPGNCLPICSNVRDQWGNCIEEGCSVWFDGCNECEVNDSMSCSENTCYSVAPGSAECRSTNVPNQPIIPRNCISWFDGCNSCSVLDGRLTGCTMMMCFVQNEPYCQVFTRGPLEIGEICYRFCEDNSQTSIDRQTDCPYGSICSSNQLDMVVIDSCGSRAHTCNVDVIGH
jgi:hypothetical protein